MHADSERGGVVATLFLMVGMVVLIAMVAVVGAGLYIAHNVRVSATEGDHGGRVSVETPFGSVRVREDSRVDPKSMGVPVYPGATLDGGHHKLASVELNFGEDQSKQLAVVAGEYFTNDSFAQVRDFYRGELPHWLISHDRHGKVCLSFTEGGYKKIVVLEDTHRGTLIKLASIGEPAAN